MPADKKIANNHNLWQIATQSHGMSRGLKTYSVSDWLLTRQTANQRQANHTKCPHLGSPKLGTSKHDCSINKPNESRFKRKLALQNVIRLILLSILFKLEATHQGLGMFSFSAVESSLFSTNQTRPSVACLSA